MALTEIDRNLLKRCLAREPGAWKDFVDRFIGLFVHVIQHTAHVRSVKLTPHDVDELAKDTRLIRNRRKIEATVQNANTMLDLDREHGGFRKYLRSFDTYDELQRDLVKRFKFMGNMGAFHFLYVVKEAVPGYEEWQAMYGTPARAKPRRAAS